MNTRTLSFTQAGWVVAALAAIAMTFVVSDSDLSDLTQVLTLAIALAGLNLLIGHSGQISVGHGAVFGLGGYSALVPVATYGWPWWAGVLLAAAICCAFGVLLGVPALRMGGANLGLLTIAVAAIFPLVLMRWKSMTGGTFGIYLAESPIEPPSWLGLTVTQFTYLICLLALALTIVTLRNLVTGRIGRALASVRTSPLLAAANGVNVNRTRLMAFVVSSTIGGLGGALYAQSLAIAVPDSYLVPFSITLLAASVVGGSRTWAGAIIGAAIIVHLPTLTESLVGGESAGNWSQLLYAMALIVSLLLAPAGLAGALGGLLGRRAKHAAPGRRGHSAASPQLANKATSPARSATTTTEGSS